MELCPFLYLHFYSDIAPEGDTSVQLKTHLVKYIKVTFYNVFLCATVNKPLSNKMFCSMIRPRRKQQQQFPTLWTVKQISYSYLNTITWTLYDRSVACIPATRKPNATSPYVLGDNWSKMHINKVLAGVAFLEGIDDYCISDMRI
jgi:hypothetical protein